MAIYVYTKTPNRLLKLIRDEIKDGEIHTWSCDADGDFTHTPEQWSRLAWFTPKIESGCLIFNIIPPRNKPISKVVYGVYHGRLIEMLLSHFDTQFNNVTSTALPSEDDIVG